MATLRTSDHSLCGPLVFAIFPLVSRCRGACRRARSGCPPHDHLALGAAVRAGTQQEVPAGAEADQGFLASRNLHSGAWCSWPKPDLVLKSGTCDDMSQPSRSRVTPC